MRKKLFTFLLALAASVGLSWAAPAVAVNGKLPGAFSVGESTVVYFSQGNLQYTKSTGKWKIMDHQYDVVETPSQNVGTDYASQDVITLFGWGTSGWDNTAADATSVHYQPYSTCKTIHNSNANINNYQYGPSNANVVGSSKAASAESWSKSDSYKNYDWGVFNSGDLGSGWRVLTTQEWGYLLGSTSPARTNAANLRTLATVNSVPGLIIMPDGWTASGVSLTVTTSKYTTNNINLTNWSTLEEQGCVFLPAAGYREGTSVMDNVGTRGFYWSSSAYSANYAYVLRFYTYSMGPQEINGRYDGCSVRLVSETAPSPAPANSCGDGLTWELNAGVFTISYDGVGTGVMDDFDYSEHPAPWQSSKESITSVIIPDGVTRIGNNAFSGAYNLASVSMGNDVVAIGNNAFEACNSLSSITLSSHVTTIGDHAFAGLQSLTSIVLPSTVQSIGTSAFYGNEGLTSITCEGTTPPTLGQYVFGMIGNGATLYVPYGYAETYQGADSQWQALNIQVIGSGSASYPYCGDGLTWTYNDGVLTIIYDGVGTGDMLDYGNYNIVPWDSYKDDITSVIIPDGVIRIGNYAFANLTNLASVSMGDDVVEIGYGGFWNCLSLQSITLGSHVTTIGEHAFGSNQALTSITLPNTLQTIGGSAFYNCNSLPTITIPSSVTSFGEYAFGMCEGLTSFTCEGTTPPTLGQDVFTMVPYYRPLYVPDGYVETYQGADSQWQRFDISIIPAPTPDPEPTPSATGVIFANCYDCWRSPDYPTISGQCYLHSFDNPRVGNNTPSGPWKLVFVENYNSSSTEYDSNIVKSDVAGEYGKNPGEMEVYRLYQWQNGAYQPVAYGVLYAYANGNNPVEHAAFFEASGFWGCYLTDNTHSSGDNINILFNEDASTGYADLHGEPTPAVDPEPTPSGDGDKLAGAFSVSGTKVVYFSKANLQATTADNGATWTWGFAENQWDYVGNSAANNAINGGGTVSTNGAVDLFAWSSTANNYFGINNSINEADYSGDFKDWGAKKGSDWRTLTINEWQYLLQERNPGSSSANHTNYPRYTNAQILTDGTAPQKDINGIILFPDDFNDGGESIDGVTWGSINPSFYSSYPTYCTTAGWATLESMGCVFLPSAGSRQKSGDEFAIVDVAIRGNYWSSTLSSGEPEDPQSIVVGNGTLGIGTNPRYFGMSVRLVSETAPSPAPAPTGLQVIELQVPGSWEGDNTLVTVSDLPGFVVFTLEEAGAWDAPDGNVNLIYTSKNNEGVRATSFFDGVWGQEYVAGFTRSVVFGWASNGNRIFYTTDGSEPTPKPSWVRDGDDWDDATKTLTVNSNPGTGAYASQSEIENLIISDAVTSIGQAAFGGCSNISYVSCGNNIQTIGVGAFTMCGFTYIELPASVTTIGNSAFYSCSNLSSVTIGNNVASIGDHAFDACVSLTEITIPASVTTIGVDAFYNCTGMTDVYCYPNAADLTWNEDGCDDFNSGNATQCHVNADQLDAYQTKFNGVVRVTFVGDLPAPTPAGLQVTELQVPASWQNDNTLVTVSDLPGFVAVSLEEAKTWDAAPAGYANLIYAGQNDDGVTATYFVDGVWGNDLPFGGFTRADIFGWASYGDRNFYTSGGSTPTPTPTPSGDANIFNYSYECDRSQYYPTKDNACNVYNFENEAAGQWKVEFLEDYNRNNTAYANAEDLWSVLGNYYNSVPGYWEEEAFWSFVDEHPVPVFTLSQWDGSEYQFVSYGLVLAYANPSNAVEHAAVFRANGSFRYLTDNTHGVYDDFNITFDSDLTDGLQDLVPEPSVPTDQEIADAVIALINAIPNPVAYNDECKNAIDAARAAYDALNAAQKDLVENYGDLLDAETAYAQLIPHPNGECGAQGDNLLWELDPSTGVLTITGSGAMYDWPYDTDLPWYDNRLQITSVVLPSGITSIGTKAFRGCTNLASINMTENYPAGLTAINQEAFCHTALTSVTIPESVVTIGQDAFYQSQSITDVYCYADPNNLTWTDFWGDDFNQSPSKSTQCHVKDCYLEVYNSKWNTNNNSTDVNVTFVGDLPGDCGGSTPANPEIKLNANFGGTNDWADTEAFTDNGDGKASWSISTLTAGSWYNFGVKVDGTWTSDNAAFSRENPSRVVSGTGEAMWFQADVAGEYTFTWEYATNTLTIGYPDIHTYTAVGQNLAIFGNSWDPSITANDLVLQEDGSYKWEKENVSFTGATTIQYRVCEDHAWGVAYPATSEQPASFEIPGLGDYKITITYNPVGNVISASAEKIAKPTIQLNANFGGTNVWADTEAFEVVEQPMDSYAKLTKLLEPGTYEFGVKVNGEWRANGSAYTRDNTTYIIEEGHTDNLTINVDVKGYYSFFWYYDDNRLAIDYSRVCGMYWKDVTAGNFEVTLGQEGEVTLPKVWATSMAFVANIANGADQVRLGSTDETVATIAYTLSPDGLGTLTFHQAGECDIYVVHDITDYYCYDSCAFHLTVHPAAPVGPTYLDADFAINFMSDPYTKVGGGDLPAGVLVEGSMNTGDPQHGYRLPVITIPVTAGNYKVMMGTCTYSNQDATIKTEDNSYTYATLATNNGTCYHNNTTANVVGAIFTVPTDQIIKVYGAEYTPFFSIEKMAAVPAFTDFEINFQSDPYGMISGAKPEGTVIAGSFHDGQHGYQNVEATVPVKAGKYRLTLGACGYGNGAGNVMSETNVELASFNQKLAENDKCYHQDPANNIVSMIFDVDQDQTITIDCGQYTPYMKLEAVTAYQVSFALSDAEGSVPAAVDVTVGEGITMPVNKTMYKEGYTLTGWSDGVNTYPIGESFTPANDVVLTPVFTANEADLLNASTDVNVKWYFGGDNGAPTTSYEGTSGLLVAQATIGDKTVDVKLAIDATSGKFAPQPTTEWAQVKVGTIFTYPYKEGMTVDVHTYSGNVTYYIADGNVTCGTNDYYSFIEVTYPASAPTTAVVIGDPNNASEVETFLSTYDGQTIDELIIDRPVLNNMYNTLCLPFDMNAAQIAASSLNGVEIREFTGASVEGTTLNLSVSDPVNAVVAGRPYFVKYSAASQLDNLHFEDVTINNALLDNMAVTFDGVTFKGTFTPFVMPNGLNFQGGYLFLGQNNQLFWPNTDNPLKPFRAYFYVDVESSTPGNAPKYRGMPARIVEGKNVATGVENAQSANQSTKVIVNGQLIIIKNDVRYNAQGQVVK